MASLFEVSQHQAKPANDPSFDLPVRYRLSAFIPRKVQPGHPGQRRPHQHQLSSRAVPAGNFYAFSAELPDDDEETDFVIDAIRAGYYGTHLSGELEHYRERDGYLDVHSFNPSMLYLQPLPGGEDQHAWVEEHGEVTYQLQPGTFDVMWDFYEATQLPEPNINNYYPLAANSWQPRASGMSIGRGIHGQPRT